MDEFEIAATIEVGLCQREDGGFDVMCNEHGMVAEDLRHMMGARRVAELHAQGDLAHAAEAALITMVRELAS